MTRPSSCSTPGVRPLGFLNVTNDVSTAAPSADTPDDMFNERVPLRDGFRTALRTYAVPLSLLLAAVVAAVVLALR